MNPSKNRNLRRRLGAGLAGVTVASVLLAGGACTSLGPLPGMTVANAVPDPRAGGELGFAAVPGTVLSDGARERVDKAEPMPQLSAWFEPGELLDQGKGLGLGMRYFGGGDDGVYEPMIRYRTWLGDHKRVAIMGVAYGTIASGEDLGATYDMTRMGGELSVDVRATPINRWIELHLTGGASLTGLWASGHYCVNKDTGYGRDCDEKDGERPDTTVSVQTAVPSAFVGAHIDLLRDIPIIHGVRLGLIMAGGLQPEFRFGEHEDEQPWFSMGGHISFGIGG